ncbi:ccr4 associated factor [Exophiala xenobiotica]|nr:ccr4 associated factor [Exophiala xenobiotica]KAK5356685.1 ccr4 associated factor [Exophiala xenobiotica]KAK5376837.1 ccr4 associated factor [Exophiala xenobiotica]KAK5406647.1 ccr4 associated factor [Exophiala xenobiotica]
MVGVPGKSQGCNTCRKRKIKCDGEKPSCGQCKRGKRECGGYQRDRHFKNLSALDRDTLLARAQPLAPLTEPSAIIYSTPSPFSSHTPVNKDQDLVPPRTELQQLQQEGQESTNLSELFYHLVSHYFPRDDWVQFLVPLQGTNFSLDLAMSALSMVRLGRLNHDETLRRQGLANYGKALEATRKATYLGEEDWLNIPWTIFPKSDFHHLLDIMARMPALVELTECLGREVDSEDIAVQKLDCLQQNWDFHSQLENWYHSLSKNHLSSSILQNLRPRSSPNR